MPSGVRVTGVEEMRHRVQALARKFPADVADALYEEVEIDATEVKRRTPVDTGALRGSVHVEGPTFEGTRVSCEIVCGGVAAPYALPVHENLDAFHKVGQAKFLESVILESRPYMARRIAARMVG